MPPFEMVKTPPLRSSIFDFPLAGLHRVVGEVALDLREGFLLGIADDRNDEPALGADGDADVVVAVLHEIIAIHAAIHRGNSLERTDGGFDEERHEAELDAVLLRECLLHPAAQAHDGAHVGFVEGREDGSGVLRHHELRGDFATQRRELFSGDAAFNDRGGVLRNRRGRFSRVRDGGDGRRGLRRRRLRVGFGRCRRRFCGRFLFLRCL